MRDVRIVAPPAEMFFRLENPAAQDLARALEPPTPEEVIQAQDVEIRRLHGELERLRITANTIGDTAACLAYLARPEHQEWVVIPQDVVDRFKDDVKLQVRSTEEGTEVRFVTRADNHVFEGRADG